MKRTPDLECASPWFGDRLFIRNRVPIVVRPYLTVITRVDFYLIRGCEELLHKSNMDWVPQSVEPVPEYFYSLDRTARLWRRRRHYQQFISAFECEAAP